MASRIRIMPEQLANKIAAGEVVERPAAVVKELVENAIDAGAHDIIIEIESGGKRLIRVVDDGPGMSREEALLSLERHATSKISTDADLDGIETLGFRGEALPSIASVSRLTLSTRFLENLEGTEIYSEGGRIVSVKAQGMAVGTMVEVRNLFFNTPARLKFMRSAETESGHVGEILARLALSRPDIRFTYICDSKNRFRVLQGQLRDRISMLLGSEVSRALMPIDAVNGPLKVKGFLSSPEISRSSAASLYTYINGRFIRDKVVQHAVLSSYRGVLERGRYPLLVLFIELPSSDLDVNVHPTKHEVRFREQSKVHDAIQSSLENVLRSTPWASRNSIKNAEPLSQPVGAVNEERISMVKDALERYNASGARQQPSVFSESYQTVSRTAVSSVNSDKAVVEQTVAKSAYHASLTVLGQYNAMYILCQDDVDLVLIDQHAAYERIAFQNLKSQYDLTGIETQGLLFPETVELTFVESACIEEHTETLHKLGFEIEHFGGSTFLLKGVPRVMTQTDYIRALRDVLAEFAQIGRSRTVEDIFEDVLANIACHSVVRGSRSLSMEQIKDLLKQMDQVDFSATCPHGRPAICRIQLGEIERMFKRSKSGSTG